MNTIVEVKNVFKIFGRNPKKSLQEIKQKKSSKEKVLKDTGHTIGLKNINMSVEQGEIFVVMGLSGSGKSTLIRCINRLIEPTDGEIYINGENILTMDNKKLTLLRRNKLSMVFQSFALLPHKNIIDNVAFGLELQSVKKEERKRRAKEMLDIVGLGEYADSMPSELSGGMQQRVGLARALCTAPEILLMDEAFSALDPLIRTEMQNELLNLQQSIKKTIIFITHDLDEALKIGDRIAIMKDGEIVQIGTPEDILKDPANDYVKDFTQNVNRAKVITASSIMKRKEYLMLPKEGLRTAIKKMQDLEISSLFVVDKDKMLKGILTIDKALELIKNKNDNIEEIIIKDINTVSPDSKIEDIMPMFLTSPFPVAVTDNGKFLGIVFKSSLINGIIGGNE